MKQGHCAWVSHNEIATAKDGVESYSFEIRLLEKVAGAWKISKWSGGLLCCPDFFEKRMFHRLIPMTDFGHWVADRFHNNYKEPTAAVIFFLTCNQVTLPFKRTGRSSSSASSKKVKLFTI